MKAQVKHAINAVWWISSQEIQHNIVEKATYDLKLHVPWEPFCLIPFLNVRLHDIPDNSQQLSLTQCKVNAYKPHRYGNSHAIRDHTVLPATRQGW